MTEQIPNVEISKETAADADWRAQRRAEKEARRAARRERRRRSPLGGLLGGATLIVIGLAYLARNTLGWELSNHWWAIFMLLPALSALATAWHFFHSEKPELRQAAYGPLFGGGFLLLIAAALFFNASWQLVWPLFLIMIGISIIVGRGLLTPASS
jgi:hypothetical protein